MAMDAIFGHLVIQAGGRRTPTLRGGGAPEEVGWENWSLPSDGANAVWRRN